MREEQFKQSKLMSKVGNEEYIQGQSQRVRSAGQAHDQNYEGTRLGERMLAHSCRDHKNLPGTSEGEKNDKQTQIKEKKRSPEIRQ